MVDAVNVPIRNSPPNLMDLRITQATQDDAAELAGVAATTFPLACPPSTPPGDVADFITINLSSERFSEYLRCPDRTVLAARCDGRIIGYAIVIRGISEDPDVAAAVTARPAVELSKLYVLPDSHGGGVAQALMDAALAAGSDTDANCIWLGVNQNNQRAQRFYTKCGFTIAGTRTFTLGLHTESDFVMVRALNT